MQTGADCLGARSVAHYGGRKTGRPRSITPKQPEPMPNQARPHKNKTLAALLAFVTGGLGLHRFYIGGMRDRWGWIHLMSLPAWLLLATALPDQPGLFTGAPLVLSVLIAFIETLVIGVTPDEKWDEFHNAGSGRQSSSAWPLAVLLVLALGGGAISLIWTIARTFDLLFTGGAYG